MAAKAGRRSRSNASAGGVSESPSDTAVSSVAFRLGLKPPETNEETSPSVQVRLMVGCVRAGG